MSTPGPESRFCQETAFRARGCLRRWYVWLLLLPGRGARLGPLTAGAVPTQSPGGGVSLETMPMFDRQHRCCLKSQTVQDWAGASAWRLSQGQGH